MWEKRLVHGAAPDGGPILAVLGKRTFRIEPGMDCEPDEEEPLPFVEADEFGGAGHPLRDPVLRESDLVAWKPRTDVVVHGNAHAPRGKNAFFFDGGISVGERSLVIRVFGNRKVDLSSGSIRFSEPEPFREMPLHSGLAYGGADIWTDPQTSLSYPRNPSGRGFAISPPPEHIHGMLLPNLENPAQLLVPGQFLIKSYERWKQATQPVHCGWTQKHSHPRILYAGLSPDQASDAEAQRQRQIQDMPEVGAGPGTQPPGRPPVLNSQYYNGAHPLMQLPYLSPGETIRLVYMDPDHPSFAFTLPPTAPRAVLDLGEGAQTMDMVLHTLEIHKPTNQLSMVWRGACRYAGLSALQSVESLFFDVFGED